MSLWELDKQAHKAVHAYLLLRLQPASFFAYPELQEFHFGKIELCWQYMFRALLFDCLHRAYLTDLNPRVHYRLEAERNRLQELRKLAAEEYSQALKDVNDALQKHWWRYSRGEFSSGEAAISDLFAAAHFLATAWEVRHVLAPINVTDRELRAAVEEHALRLQELQIRIPPIARLQLPPYAGLLDAVGRLRYQKRWGKEFRLPETTVLGHSLLVTLVVHLLVEALKIPASSARLTILTALFHDLPEALVRDIPRPVRKKIPDVVREVEAEEMNLLLRGLGPEIEWELRVFSGTLPELEMENQEFQDLRLARENAVEPIEDGTTGEEDVRWGRLVKQADDFCAWLEALWTIERGIRSQTLERWLKEFPARLKSEKAASDVERCAVELLDHAVAEMSRDVDGE